MTNKNSSISAWFP